ncbi:hypothetical protein PpBr36_06907 [Pyricularia pennisetigena]|uniref:hypothetical protein n=1 Tax=Pyricularia pennisetigena TaxID=1578925 RepID=UPI00114EFABD|nr:hypothetical protein PpBr36_06907 [Pyricularia pennisetigena]TLS25366.1 hypothetical protein PpBr36_06907 [Pyricularia pennisetigena]
MLFLFILILFQTVAILAFTDIGTSLNPVYNENTIPNHTHGALKKRGYITRSSGCSNAQASEIYAALESCALLASLGYHTVKSDNRLFELIFKTNRTNIQNLVQNNFNEIYRECSRTSDELSITCGDISDGWCVENGVYSLGYARIAFKQIVICPRFFNHPAKSKKITAVNQDTVILHEVAHIVLNAHVDYGYEWEGIQKLDSTKSIKNPDSYAIFAQCARYKSC